MLAVYALILCTFAILPVAEQCPDGQYWCGDRCGTDVDTCCWGPEGQDHLCGIETICCGYGCCPNSSYTCNADFSCVGPDGEVIPSAPSSGIPDTDSSGADAPALNTLGHEETETSQSIPTGTWEDAPPEGLDPGSPSQETGEPSLSGTPGAHQTGVIPGLEETTPPDSTNYSPTAVASLDETVTVAPDLSASPSQAPGNSDNAGPGSGNSSDGNAPLGPEPAGQPEDPVDTAPPVESVPGFQSSSPISDVSQESTEELPVSTPIPELSNNSPQEPTEVPRPTEEPSNKTLQQSSGSETPPSSPEESIPEPAPSGRATEEPLKSEPALESSDDPLPESTRAPEETQDTGETGIAAPPLAETEMETTVTSTITELPPGALLETLGSDFTKGTVVTTTSSGSDDPTVVPVIVPIGAPPQICWGCVPSFPANIQIKLPQFCVNILGFKVGNCPSGEDTIINGDNENGETEGEGEDEDEDESSTTSCSITVTATHASVFCSVTEDAASRDHMGRQDEPACSTLAYTTVVDCETIAGSTTTSFIPHETEVRCSPETCGDWCPVEKRDSHLVKRMRPFRPEQPEENTWPDPSMYGGDTQKFMRTEVAEAYDWSQYGRGTQVMITNTNGAVTSNWVEFTDKVATLGLRGLFGCTAVVVVSRKGAWMGHFWEDRFTPSDIVPVLARGTGRKYSSEYGLEQLRNNNALNIGHIFDDENMPRIFILAPRKKVYVDNAVQDDSEHAGGDVLRHEVYVESMKAELEKIFGDGFPISTVTYMPIAYPLSGRNFYDDDFETHRGKVLIQYQPSLGDCRPQSKWRVWFEGREPGGNEQDEWTPAGNQKITKRQEACPNDENGDASDDDPAESSAAESGVSHQTSALGISATPGSSTATSSSPTAGPTGCSDAEDCVPAIICSGGAVNACKDGICVCNAPAMGASTCDTTANCEETLECNEDLAPTCWGGDCVCMGPEEASTDNEEPTATGNSDASDPSETCNLHIREYYYAAIYREDFRVEYSLNRGNEKVAADTLNEKKWDEEILVDVTDTGLERPVSITMSREREDAPRCEELPDIAPGGDIHRRQGDCLVPEERLHLVKLKYGDIEWDSEPDQDTDKMPHCEVGDWEVMGWEGISNRLPNREMDCRFLC